MSFPSYFIDDPAVALRQPEVPLASFADGGNAAGLCAPGIGINYTVPPTPVVGTPEQFTLLDQREPPTARTPQISQAIGGFPYTDQANVYPSSGGEAEFQPQNVIRITDGDTLDGTGTTVGIGNATLLDLNGWTAV